MNDEIRQFTNVYLAALEDYLASGGEAPLHRAYELGRTAIARGFSVMEIAAIHHHAIAKTISAEQSPARVIGLASNFFSECVSLFEMTHRGFRDTITRLEAEISERKRTEDHLRKREAQLEKAQSLAHLGSWEWDLDANKVHWSNELYRIYGLTPQESEPTFESYLERVHPDDRAHARGMIEAALRERTPFAFEERVLRPDGTLRVLHSQGEVIVDRRGTITTMRGICHDITEQQEADDALRESEERYRRIVETAEEGIWVLDEKNRTTFVNSKIAEMLGFSVEEMSGQPLDAFIPESDLKPVLANLDRRRQGFNDQHDLRFHRRDETELWALLSATSILDRDGRYCGALAMITDITKRKHAERQLQESEERFRSLIENTSDIITILGTDGTVLYQSPSVTRVLGYEQEELLGHNVFLYIHPDDVEPLIRVFEYGIRIPGYTDSRVFRFRHKDQSWRTLEGVGKNLVDVPGVSGILVSSRDLTDKMRLQRQLDEAARQRSEDIRKFAVEVQRAQEEERQRIARELHDDICQRLSALRLHVSVLEDTLTPSRKANLHKLHSIKKQLDSMITDVRRMSANLRPMALDLFGLVTALRFLCEEIEKLHGIQVVFEHTDDLHARYDANVEIALYRIAQEALTNAAKHAQADNVLLSLSHQEGVIVIAIQDNGIGFAVEAQQPFRAPGQNMGLVSMKERAALLGGTCHIVSLPQRGTIIRVEIPIDTMVNA